MYEKIVKAIDNDELLLGRWTCTYALECTYCGWHLEGVRSWFNEPDEFVEYALEVWRLTHVADEVCLWRDGPLIEAGPIVPS